MAQDNEKTPPTGGNTPKKAATPAKAAGNTAKAPAKAGGNTAKPATGTSAKDRSRQQSRPVSGKAATGKGGNAPKPGGGKGGNAPRSGKAVATKPPSNRGVLIAWVSVGVVIVIIAVLVIINATSSTTAAAGTPVTPVPASILSAVTSIPTSVYDAVGTGGSASTPPTVLSGQPPLTINGQSPAILYVGAEYCPFCAAERWPLVVALARFGRFTALHDAVSSAQTVFPSTSTFSFVGVAYTSRWVTLTGVELFSDQTGPDGAFRRLARLTPAQAAVVARTAPSAGGLSAGGTPFLDVAGRLATTTSGFSPALLAGQSQAQIADAAASPTPAAAADGTGTTTPPTGQAVLAVANQLSAGICAATGQQPASVCLSKGVLAADTALGLSRPAAASD